MSHFSSPLVLGVNATVTLPTGANSVRLFLPVTAGTLTITKRDGTVILNAFPVTAGVWVDLCMHTGDSATLATAGGASGTILLN